MKWKPVIIVGAALLVLAGAIGGVLLAYPSFRDALLGKLGFSQAVHGESQVQLSYERACRLMRTRDEKGAKALCLDLLKRHADGEVKRGKDIFLLAPAVLDMLGQIYLHEKNAKAALACYKRMESQYGNAYICRYTEGEESWAGKAGPLGIIGQIHVKLDLEKNYPEAKKLAYRLIDDYRGQSPQLWEGTTSYEEIAKEPILTCLDATHVTLEKREEEYQTIIRRSGNQALAAGLLLDLAKRNRGSDDEPDAIRLYRELIDKYGSVYVGNVEDDFVFFGLQAYEELIAIYRNQGEDDSLREAQYGMRDLYNRMVRKLKDDNEYENAEDFIAGYEESFKGIGESTGEEEPGYEEEYGD